MISFSAAALRAGAVFAVFLSAPAFAQKAPSVSEPSLTTATFADWTQRCVRETDVVVCEVMQTLKMEGQAAPVAQIAIGRITSKAPLRLTIILPVNASFEKGPQMQIEETPASQANLAWRRCANFGCVADLEIKSEVLNAWRVAAKPGQIAFRNAANQDVVMPFSFRGLAQALDAMPKG